MFVCWSLCVRCVLHLLYELVFVQQQQFGDAVLLLQHQGEVLDGPEGQFILQGQNNVLEWWKSNSSDPLRQTCFTPVCW